ncbi:flagellar hook-basal body complex protein FliE [Oscillospiraceae bacterium CM]|nr:flagellar hook-basal body complex protein FliE [Oscillospiraceae bacterium CM]
MVSIGSSLISNLGSIANPVTAKPVSSGTTTADSGFKEALSSALDRFEQVGDENAQSTLDLLTGNTDDLSNTMIAAQKSEISLNLTVALRNKAVEAYKEIMNMQV